MLLTLLVSAVNAANLRRNIAMRKLKHVELSSVNRVNDSLSIVSNKKEKQRFESELFIWLHMMMYVKCRNYNKNVCHIKHITLICRNKKSKEIILSMLLKYVF